MLTLTTHRGDIWSDLQPLAKNLFLIDNPVPDGGDFVATTCLDAFKPMSPFQQAGLLVYDNDDKFLKWTCEFSRLGKRVLVITREEGGSPASMKVDANLDVDRLWLRLVKRGRLYEIASSSDGQSFTMRGEFFWGNGAPKQIGLMAMNGLTDDMTDAHFDFFEVRLPTPQEADTARLNEREKLWGIWLPVSGQLSGEPLEEAQLSRLAFTESHMRVTDKKRSLEAEYTLDVTTEPKQILMWVNRSGRTIVQRFAYSLEEDTLTVCFNKDPEGPAPAKLETETGDGNMLVTFKRAAGQ
jgi:uncharacterized protein (TIGR03067 family)